MSKKEIFTKFPIPSQTSKNDKVVILQIISLFKKYNYCEIGSFLGGSLTPHLMSENCSNILSIDDRERIQPDERGILYDYQGVTSDKMITNLKNVGLDVTKLKTFDKSIQFLPTFEKIYDLVFIDGEHTDLACFRDFLYSMKIIKNDGIILFHDSTIVYKGIQMCLVYLESNNIFHKFIKISNSEMSIIFLKDYSSEIFKIDTLESFYSESERYRIEKLIKNKISKNGQIIDTKIEKVLTKE